MNRLTKKVDNGWKYELEYSCLDVDDNKEHHLVLGDIYFVNKLGNIEDLMEKYNVELGELDFALWHYAKCVRNFDSEYDEKLFKKLKKRGK